MHAGPPSFTQRTAAALAAIILAASPATSPAIAISELSNTASEVRGLLRAHYLDAEALSLLPPDADATTLVRRLGDRYSQVLSRQEVAKLLRRYDPAGLNLQVDDASGQLEVGVEPPAGSEAERAGVRMGDRVVSLGGRGTRGLNIDEAEWLAMLSVDEFMWAPHLKTVAASIRKLTQSEPMAGAIAVPTLAFSDPQVRSGGGLCRCCAVVVVLRSGCCHY